jgi:molybdopterin converting factor small subunit
MGAPMLVVGEPAGACAKLGRMPKVIVPAPYRGPTSGVGEVGVEGSTVRECLDAVETRFPGFGPQVFDGEGQLHRFVKVFVNGDLIERQALEQAVGPNDEVEVLAAIAGGSDRNETA